MSITDAYSNALILQNLQRVKKFREARGIMEEKKEIDNCNLKDVKGIGEKTLIELISNGINTVEKLKATSDEDIKKIVRNPITLKNILLFKNN